MSFDFSLNLQESQTLVYLTLSSISSNDQNDRRRAELSLKEFEIQAGYGFVLITLLGNTSLPVADRQLAGIILRQYIDKHWDEDSDNFVKPVITETDKQKIRLYILQLISDRSAKVRTIVGMAISTIAKSDFPNSWPSFLNSIFNFLCSDNSCSFQGALKTLSLFAENIKPYQLHYTIPTLFPVIFEVLKLSHINSLARSKIVALYRLLIVQLFSLGDHDLNHSLLYPSFEKWIQVFENIFSEDTQVDSNEFTSSHGCFSLKWEALKVILILVQNYTDLIQPFLPMLLTAIWRFTVWAASFYVERVIDHNNNCEIQFHKKLAVKESRSLGDPDDIDFNQKVTEGFLDCVLSLFGYISQNHTTSSILNSNNTLEELAFVSISLMQLSEETLSNWRTSPNEYTISEEDEGSNNTGDIRTTAKWLINTLGEVYSTQGVRCISNATMRCISISEQCRQSRLTLKPDSVKTGNIIPSKVPSFTRPAFAPGRAIPPIKQNLPSHATGESHATRQIPMTPPCSPHNTSTHWWKLKESAILTIGLISQQIIDDSNNLDSKYGGMFNFSNFIKQIIIPELISCHSYPYILLKCRALWCISYFTEILPRDLWISTLNSIIVSLDPKQHIFIRISAARALGLVTCNNFPEEQEFFNPICFNNLYSFILEARNETLQLLLDTLLVVLKEFPKLCVLHEENVTSVVLRAWLLNSNDQLVTECTIDIFQLIGSNLDCLPAFQKHVFPCLHTVLEAGFNFISNKKRAIRKDKQCRRHNDPLGSKNSLEEYLSSLDQEQISEILEGSMNLFTTIINPSVPDLLPDFYLTKVCPTIIEVISLTDEYSVIMSGVRCLTSFIKIASRQISRTKVNEVPLLRYILDVIGKCLHPTFPDYAALPVCRLVSHVFYRFWNQLGQQTLVILLTSIVEKLSLATLPSLICNILLIFSHLLHTHGEKVLDFLQKLGGIKASNRVQPALSTVLFKWVEHQHEITIPYHLRVSSSALCLLLSLRDTRLEQIQVEYDDKNKVSLLSKILSILVRTWNNESVLPSTSKSRSDEYSSVKKDLIDTDDPCEDEDFHEVDPDSTDDPLNEINLQAYIQDFLQRFAAESAVSINKYSVALSHIDQNLLQRILLN